MKKLLTKKVIVPVVIGVVTILGAAAVVIAKAKDNTDDLSFDVDAELESIAAGE